VLHHFQNCVTARRVQYASVVLMVFTHQLLVLVYTRTLCIMFLKSDAYMMNWIRWKAGRVFLF